MPDLVPYKAIIRNKKQVIFSGEVLSLSSRNAKGPFDVLAHHAYFISSMQEFIRVQLPSGKEQNYEINYGVIHIQDEEAKVFVGL